MPAYRQLLSGCLLVVLGALGCSGHREIQSAQGAEALTGWEC